MFIEIKTIDSVCEILNIKKISDRTTSNELDFYAMNVYANQVNLQGEYSSDLAHLIKDKFPDCHSWVCSAGYVKFSFETSDKVVVSITLT